MTPTVRVQLFAAARDAAGIDTLWVEVPGGSETVAHLRLRIAEQSPALADLLPRCRLAVDDEFASDDDPVAIGQSVAVLPPVSGG
jgi:molybdopterin converting factor subunit 1